MNKPLFQITLGVDIAKKKFDAASLIEGKYKHKHFTNDVSGYTAFIIWFTALCETSMKARQCYARLN